MRFLQLSYAFLAGCTFLAAQNLPPLPAAAPPEGETDKCYAICYNAPRWETITENVETYGGGSRIVAVTPEFETIRERVMVRPAAYRLVTVPATYREEEQTIEVAAAYVEYEIEEAEWETVTERVLVEGGTDNYRTTPARYATVTNANLYYGSPDPDANIISGDLGNVLDPDIAPALRRADAPFSPANPDGLLNDPSSPLNASPGIYGNDGPAALLDAENPDSPFHPDYVAANGIEAATERANEILAAAGVGAIAPYLESEARVEIDRIPREFEVTSEEIEVQAGYVTYERLPAPCADGTGDCISWCAVAVPAQYATVNRKIGKDCPAGYSVASLEQGGKEYCVRLRYVPAVYGARQVMTAGPGFTTTTSEPRYREIRVRKLVRPARVVEREVPARYETVVVKVVDQPAYTRYELIPPEYETVTRRVRRGLGDAGYLVPGGVLFAQPLVDDDSTVPEGGVSGLPANPAAGYPVEGNSLPISYGSGPVEYGNVTGAGFGAINTDPISADANMPDNFYTAGCPEGFTYDPRDGLCKATAPVDVERQSITRRVMNGEGNFSSWEEVLCPNRVTAVSIRRLQRALSTAGYDAGVADGIMGAKTKSALAAYQRDKGLPIGGMNTATLRSLGLR